MGIHHNLPAMLGLDRSVTAGSLARGLGDDWHLHLNLEDLSKIVKDLFQKQSFVTWRIYPNCWCSEVFRRLILITAMFDT